MTVKNYNRKNERRFFGLFFNFFFAVAMTIVLLVSCGGDDFDPVSEPEKDDTEEQADTTATPAPDTTSTSDPDTTAVDEVIVLEESDVLDFNMFHKPAEHRNV
ncbi:MAG: hypothetical protein PF436_06265, partial [Prolixibacteraceae bacterium]|nr:hypothetical protein [Prolixibacteraceae bacterium]